MPHRCRARPLSNQRAVQLPIVLSQWVALMRDAVKWHSENACEFDLKYRSSQAFIERLIVWDSLINMYVHSDFEVLDVGCGSGVITALAARRARRVLGFDGSAEMVAL